MEHGKLWANTAILVSAFIFNQVLLNSAVALCCGGNFLGLWIMAAGMSISVNWFYGQVKLHYFFQRLILQTNSAELWVTDPILVRNTFPINKFNPPMNQTSSFEHGQSTIVSC